jgi:hypothetical protein
MSLHGCYGATRKASIICIILLASHVMSAVVVAQETAPKKNPLNVTISRGFITQDAPIPAIPDDQTQNCPPWETMNPPRMGNYLPCPVVAQAGVPFNGWIATQALCSGDRIEKIYAPSTFTTSGPSDDSGNPIQFTEDFPIYYDANGHWPDLEHLGGSHLWEVPGKWSIGGQAVAICDHHNTNPWHPYDIGAQATVFAATAPESITALGNRADQGQTYHNFARVTLYDKAPASGSLVMLMTGEPEVLPKVIDVQTQFATTGLQLGTNIVYLSTYLYIPPGQKYADFDLLVAASAHAGDVVGIYAKCVGEPKNWIITNHCDKVNQSPRVLKVTITKP